MRDDPGSNSGRREVGGGLQALLGAPMTAYRGCGERDGGLRHGERRSRTGMARVGGDVPFAGGRVSRQRCRQAGNGRARNRARARLNWVSQSQRWGRCRVRRRAEWVSRPAREKNRRRRVLVVTICSPRPMRAVQRAKPKPRWDVHLPGAGNRGGSLAGVFRPLIAGPSGSAVSPRLSGWTARPGICRPSPAPPPCSPGTDCQ